MSLANPTQNHARTVAAGRRAALVTALATVPGVTATSSAPDQATAGAAWPRWIQTTYRGVLSELSVDEFDVFAVLPADYAPATVDEGDSLRDAIAPALATVCQQIQYAEPITVAFNENQSMPGVRFRVTIR